MRKNILLYMKKIMILILAMALVLSTISCDLLKAKQSNNDSNGNDIGNSSDITELPVTGKDVIKQTAFEKDIIYLSGKGIQLPDLSPNSSVMTETFLTLLVEAYESLGVKIDISKINPDIEISNAVKKMTLLGVYENNFMVDNTMLSDLTYGTAAYWFMKLQDSIQKRMYWRSDSTATIGDLLRRINVSNTLHTWTQDLEEVKTYTLGDLIENEVESDQHLTRLLASEMLVSAYEDTCEELQINDNPKFSDTDNINAKKSNQFFFWPESEKFEPEKTGKWDDWSFMAAIIYDSQLRLSLKLEESNVPYGAVTAAMTSLIKAYDELDQNIIEEKIVLNERPYDWYVNQQETGEYSINNCMPSCIEMAIRYQGLSKVPSTEKLRKDNPLNGLGWNDVLAENVMLQYGLKFTDSFDINLDKMLELLDNENILYVMYREPTTIGDGHSVIIKGYWKLGDNYNFIISDPNNNTMGPFGYLEYIKDAQTMLADMERQVPRYFIIPTVE